MSQDDTHIERELEQLRAEVERLHLATYRQPTIAAAAACFAFGVALVTFAVALLIPEKVDIPTLFACCGAVYGGTAAVLVFCLATDRTVRRVPRDAPSRAGEGLRDG